MKCIKNCCIYTGEELLYDRAIVIDGNKILDLVSNKCIPLGIETIDLNGKCISPGFIDLQINGGGGVLFNDDISCDSIRKIKNAHLKYGVTSFLPTLVTTSIENVKKAIFTIKEYIRSGEGNVLGLHLEGPFINTKKAGAHKKSHIIEYPSITIVKDIIDGNEDVIKMITIAPEVIDEKVLEYLFSTKICVSIGHSDITYAEAAKLLGNKITCATHLFNAMSSLKGREPGLVGSIIKEGINAGIIADGQHVHFTNILLAKRLLQEKLFLISDAMPIVGYSDGIISSDEYIYEGNKCVNSSGTLAGSVLNMFKAIKNCVQEVGISLDEALRMATQYPARVIGVGNKYGNILPGYNADMLVFDKDLNIYSVINQGDVCCIGSLEE